VCVKGVTRSNETEADAHTACHTAKKSGDPDAETNMSLTLFMYDVCIVCVCVCLCVCVCGCRNCERHPVPL